MVRLCLTIGVSRARPLPSLQGALTAAREMSEWAERAGYTTIALTDEAKENPVTVARIRQALLDLLPDNDVVESFILHFAGHGLREGAEQNLWFPTDWHDDMRVISVEGLKRQLFRHGIQNLTIISDACRSQPADVEMTDLTRDQVLPRGPYESESPIIDRFNAVTDGQKAYMLNADAKAPSRCIFSTVLLEGLYGHREEAFDKHVKDSVIPESLALFSTLRMKEIGEQYRLKCIPDNTVGIPREHIIYHQRSKAPAGRPPPPKWPAPPTEPKNADGIVISWQTTLDHDVSEEWAEEVRVNSRRQEVRSSFRLNDHPWQGNVNLVVLGERPRRVWARVPPRMSRELARSSEHRVKVDDGHAAQVLVEFDDGVFASAVVYADLVTVLSRNEAGVIGWACASKWSPTQPQIDLSLDTIADLHLGNLTADQVDEFAVKLREMKHLNPIFGAVSSYLYDYSGDIDSIRRMAYFYCHYHQSIPFDIAYMGLLEIRQKYSSYEARVPAVKKRPSSARNKGLPEWVTRSTKSTEGTVAGFWPWLRQGWEFIENPENEEKDSADSLRDIIPFLRPSPFTSFQPEGAKILIERFHLEENQ